MKKIHYTDRYLLNPYHPVTVFVIGAGGTGSQVATGLARMSVALQALGHPGLHVTVFDPDTVTEANIGAFKPCAKKYDIDFTLRKDRTTHPPRYIVIFKSKQADNLEQAFKEFTAKKLQQQERPSIRKTLAVLKEKAAARSSQQAKEKIKERGLSR